MSTSETSRPAANFLLRHYVELLTVLAVLFVLQTGLVPFDFAVKRPEGISAVFFSAAVSDLTFPDTVSNIFLYVPLGILVHWSLCRALNSRILALLLTTIVAAGTSAAVEWIQAFSVARVSSVVDFVANVVGAVLGASLSWVVRRIIPPILDGALHEIRERPQALLVKVYCVALVIFAALPFSFSFDAFLLKKAVRSANFVPFAANDVTDAKFEELLSAGDHRALAFVEWQKMKRWSRWAAECLSFVVLAWLLHPVIRNDYGFPRASATIMVWYFGGMLAVGLSALQLPVVSRACDVTDIVFRLFGVWIGLVTRSFYVREGERLTPELQTQCWHRLAKTCLAATVAYVLYTGLAPFTLDAGRDGAVASLSSRAFLPFFAYFRTRFDLMIADAMEKFACYVVFSFLLVMCWSRVRVLNAKSRVLRVTVVGVAISVGIEIAQMFISIRVTSLTDPILACGGCLTGVLAQHHAVQFYRFAKSYAVPEAEGRHRVAEPARGLAPGDALVATLTEQHGDAPKEKVPTRTTKAPRQH